MIKTTRNIRLRFFFISSPIFLEFGCNLQAKDNAAPRVMVFFSAFPTRLGSGELPTIFTRYYIILSTVSPKE
jgi:hypothetical protein